MTESTTIRGTCWSITINNPLPTDLLTQDKLPSGWAYEGQIEEGEKNGTPHAQLMLLTPQVRLSQVKGLFPRAHIEKAKNKAALKKYVHKDDTRIMEIPTVSSAIPTLFDYQATIADKWVGVDFDNYLEQFPDKEVGEVALIYVDHLVEQDIIAGMRGIEYIAINPMWRSSWKKFWRGIILRHRSIKDAPSVPLQEETLQETEVSESSSI